jgi:hypothetical protein
MFLAKAKRTTPGADDKFDAYLRERFAELKRELDAQLAAGEPKGGVLRKFAARVPLSARGGWTVGIAALLLTAVSVPLVMQLNQQREQMRTATVTLDQPSASATRENTPAEAEDEETSPPEGNSGRKQQANRTERFEKDSADTKESELAFKKRAQPTIPLEDKPKRFAESEEAMPQGASAASAPPRAAAAEAPAMEQAKGERGADDSAVSGAPAMPEAKARSAPVPDAQFRLKKAELDAIEKHEMELLWKEYEKNPKEFLKDKRKTERLKTLLARHDTRSRARRMLAQ